MISLISEKSAERLNEFPQCASCHLKGKFPTKNLLMISDLNRLFPEYRILALRCRRAEYGPSAEEIAKLPATMIDLAAPVATTVFRREV